jgi:cysteine desulfurase
MTDRLYFDWNATAPLRPEARAAMIAALGGPTNASSVHGEGRAARAIVEKARGQVAAMAGAEMKNVTFTSGATEANMLALTPHLETSTDKAPRDRLFVAATEHPSVRGGGRFAAGDVEEVAVDSDGIVDLGELKRRLAAAKRPLVSVMLANNESGVVQPIFRIAEVVHAANGLLHTDAVQAPGRIECDIDALGADLMTLSSHKIGGPQGAGALIRRGDVHISDALIKGGGQERGLRGGTESVAALAGYGAAAEVAATRGDVARIVALRDRLETGLKSVSLGAMIFGEGVQRLPNTSFFAISGAKAETAIIALDLNGIAVSSGSACSSGKVQGSPVLAAMGVRPEIARGAIRASIGWTTTEAEIDRFLQAWKTLATSLLKQKREIAA